MSTARWRFGSPPRHGQPSATRSAGSCSTTKRTTRRLGLPPTSSTTTPLGPPRRGRPSATRRGTRWSSSSAETPQRSLGEAAAAGQLRGCRAPGPGATQRAPEPEVLWHAAPGRGRPAAAAREALRPRKRRKPAAAPGAKATVAGARRAELGLGASISPRGPTSNRQNWAGGFDQSTQPSLRLAGPPSQILAEIAQPRPRLGRVDSSVHPAQLRVARLARDSHC
mmetsp:Transcript_96056/g.310159  ORF Transcript_96056/g.310159 Transcript_96056/m.310159 type:complete len:224 (+) Transcript_96056:923-1594(+)